MEEQSDQLEKLKRELAAKAGELAQAQEALSRTEQVPAGWGHWMVLALGWGRSCLLPGNWAVAALP